MSQTLPPCPKCSSEYSYELSGLLICPECAHEWSPSEVVGDANPDTEIVEELRVVKDAVGNVLSDGDTVAITRDLKVKGAANAIKVGTRVRGIRLIEPVNGHDIDAKVDGFGSMHLKSSVVKIV